MERELAKHLVVTAFRSASMLQELLVLLQGHCDASEYEEYAKSIASISAEISLELLNPIFQKHPDIKQEAEQKIAKYGKFI
jgi:hypothetical protein